ncbi:hypothetical protein RJ640_014564 [Escallonia rubra]|uniref:NAC domain-containing protein n=1 Tax=Escallonia rubra TaxID=112253 RepID=A0AA88RDX3_9ASTE|nr:hypothetical protein RJ640_014564 [Escallonia rubra]
MARTSLPPGFRFHPTDVELVMYYLKRKMMGKKLLFEAISELNIYKFCPWDLPDKCCLKSKDLEWYFFCPREKKYASGARANRATENGYWKATGKDRSVRYNNNIVAMTKTLVFHLGHAPEGKRTDWVMHEYRIEDKGLADAEIVQDYVLCKVFQKSGPGPKNGAQYGAPFNEEEWNDDGEICLEFSQANGLDSAFIVPPNNQKSSAVTSTTVPGNRTSWSFLQPGPSAASDVPPDMPDDDIVSLLAMFTEDSTSLPMGNEANFEEHMAGGNDIYDGLGDLGNFADLYEGGVNFSGLQESAYASAFLELNDLNTPLPCPAEACGSELLLADRSYPPYEYCANSEQFYYSGAVQNDSLNQPLALAESNCLRNHFEVLEGIMDGATHECSNSSLSVASCGPLGGSNGAAPTQTQGMARQKKVWND